jgi:site-specific recombinase XerD
LERSGRTRPGSTLPALRTFIIEAASPHGRSKAKMVVTAARAFLRYLISEGHCRLGLDGAIPTIGRWRLAALPRYLPASDIDRLVAACDPAVSQGARDRAIILLLARLGLRAGDVASLRMADIDWVRATLLVSGKSRAATTLPLPQDVGDAILLYVEHGRPETEVAEIFVRALAPRTGLGRSGVTSVVASAMRRAGVISPSRGAHTLRHSAATAMLRQGVSLAAIGAVLRHRSEETTRLYAKVDVALLRQLALPWPEVSPC